MQIVTPPLAPLPNTTVAPQTVVQSLPHVHALSAAPLTQRAVAPTPKPNRDKKTRNNEERSKGGDKPPRMENEGDRGHFINTSV